MSIINREIDREFDFNKHLEGFKDPKTEHIMLSPEQAKDIIFEFAIYESLGKIGRTPPEYWPDWVVVMAQKVTEGKKFDFTEALEEFKKKAEKEFWAEEERKFGKKGINIISPIPPSREMGPF